ncbi:MAG TPA: hypothetical protein VGA87_02640, partial [Pyrinomonadaceae bacterium]
MAPRPLQHARDEIPVCRARDEIVRFELFQVRQHRARGQRVRLRRYVRVDARDDLLRRRRARADGV